MKSAIIGLKDLRENMENYIAQVQKGRSFVVVRKSKPVFKLEPLDEWGDEGVWEKVIDFTKIKKGGVLLEDILSKM
ncbi:MAG: type II toxin-antitoxin system prevent-host-death family antitoxin [Candidatus Pacebacteria bacterium]|nr:type II toxin-antitoxin system prevent-host-death family antitoxin [Candidatus Paceibacterota bacterium]